MNPYRSDLLRLSAAVAERMTGRLAPFGEDGLQPWLQSLAFASAVSDAVTQIHRYMFDKYGDGTKRAVLLFAATAAEVENRRVAEAVSVMADRAVRAGEAESRRLNSVEQLFAASVTCAGGREDIATALVEAFRESGADGRITIDPDPDSDQVTWELVEDEHVLVRVGGRTDSLWHAVNGLHGSRMAIATGVMPGGGAAFAQAADVYRDEAADDTTTGAAARALMLGLEAPLRAWVAKAGQEFKTVLDAVRGPEPMPFDVASGEPHNDYDRPPWDGTDGTLAAITCAAEAVIDLFAG